MAGERSSSEPPQEDSKGLRSISHDDDSDDINMSGERENGENGEESEKEESRPSYSPSLHPSLHPPSPARCPLHL